jgi:hypothetical protein
LLEAVLENLQIAAGRLAPQKRGTRCGQRTGNELAAVQIALLQRSKICLYPAIVNGGALGTREVGEWVRSQF